MIRISVLMMVLGALGAFVFYPCEGRENTSWLLDKETTVTERTVVEEWAPIVRKMIGAQGADIIHTCYMKQDDEGYRVASGNYVVTYLSYSYPHQNGVFSADTCLLLDGTEIPSTHTNTSSSRVVAFEPRHMRFSVKEDGVLSFRLSPWKKAPLSDCYCQAQLLMVSE